MPDLSVVSVFTEYTEVEMNLQAFNFASLGSLLGESHAEQQILEARIAAQWIV